MIMGRSADSMSKLLVSVVIHKVAKQEIQTSNYRSRVMKTFHSHNFYL